MLDNRLTAMQIAAVARHAQTMERLRQAPTKADRRDLLERLEQLAHIVRTLEQVLLLLGNLDEYDEALLRRMLPKAPRPSETKTKSRPAIPHNRYGQAVMHNGVRYSSLCKAGAAKGVAYNTVKRWCTQGVDGWSWAD